MSRNSLLLPHRVAGRRAASNAPVLVFLSGFPDDERSFEKVAKKFERTHTTICLALPGFSASQRQKIPRWGYDFDEIVRAMDRTIKSVVGPSKRVACLVGHDWGSVISFLYCERHAVEKFVTLDVGIAWNDLSWTSFIIIAAYLTTLALAFLCRALGLSFLGFIIVSIFPYTLIGPIPYETHLPARATEFVHHLDLGLCYPFFHFLKHFLFGVRRSPSGALNPRDDWALFPLIPPNIPTLFLFGTRKRAAFHGDAFLNAIDSRHDGSTWGALDTGHFLHTELPDELAAILLDFLS